MTYALVRRSSDQSLTVSTWAAVSFDVETADPGNFYSSGQPTRLTIPAGVDRVMLAGVVGFTSGLFAGEFNASWGKNGSRIYPGSPYYAVRQINAGFANNHSPAYSGILPVVDGDYFELFGISTTSSVLSFNGSLNRCWGSIRDMTGVPACTVCRSSTQSPIAGTWSTGDVVLFNSTLFDDIGAYNGSNPERLTVPAGVSLVRLTAQVRFPDDGDNAFLNLAIRKNGTAAHTDRGRTTINRNVSGVVSTLAARTPALAVSPGDYFDVFVSGNDTDHNAALADLTWFTMEVLQTT
jgi:hypothetical protein